MRASMRFSPGSCRPGCAPKPQRADWNVTPRSGLCAGKFLCAADKRVYNRFRFSEAKNEKRNAQEKSRRRHEYRRYTELRGDDDYLRVALLKPAVRFMLTFLSTCCNPSHEVPRRKW